MFLLWLLAPSALSFAPTSCRSLARAWRGAVPVCATGLDTFSSASWPTLQATLDLIPVFSCADEQAAPIQYERNGTPLALFYADVEAAQAELASSREMFPHDPIDLVPFGLGAAFKLAAEDKAMLIPSSSEITAAGGPPGVSPVGQALPLFVCMEMSEEQPDGTPRLPLFMSKADALKAIAEATETDSPEEQLDLVCISLDRAIELLVTVEPGKEAPSFRFIPPSSSLRFINEYVNNDQQQ